MKLPLSLSFVAVLLICLLNLQPLLGSELAQNQLSSSDFFRLHNENASLEDQISSARLKWKDFATSDPKKNPKKFVYLVSAFRIDALKDNSHKVNIIQQPEFFHNLPVVSVSLISHRNTCMYSGQFGVILEVPMENIYATRPIDMQTGLVRSEFARNYQAGIDSMKKYFAIYGIQSPQFLLKNTLLGTYNEILCIGHTSSGSKIRVRGFFTKVTAKTGKDQFIQENGDYQFLKNIAARNRLPLIQIVEHPFDFELFKKLVGESWGF